MAQIIFRKIRKRKGIPKKYMKHFCGRDAEI